MHQKRKPCVSNDMRLRKTVYTALTVFLILGAAGCHKTISSTKNGAPITEKFFIAQPCEPLLNQHLNANDPVSTQWIFLEIVHVQSSDLPNPIGEWLRTHAVETDHICSYGLLVEDGISSKIPWGDSLDADYSSAAWQLQTTVRTSQNSKTLLDISVTLEPTQPGQKIISFQSVQTEDQQPIVIPFFDPVATQLENSQIVLTPYILGDRTNLELLMRCKENAAKKEKENY